MDVFVQHVFKMLCTVYDFSTNYTQLYNVHMHIGIIKCFFLELWNIFESHYSWRNIQQYNVDGSWFLKKSSHYFFFAFCLIRSTHVYSDSYCIHASPLYFLNSCWNMVFWFICRARYFFSLSFYVIHSIEFHR